MMLDGETNTQRTFMQTCIVIVKCHQMQWSVLRAVPMQSECYIGQYVIYESLTDIVVYNVSISVKSF